MISTEQAFAEISEHILHDSIPSRYLNVAEGDGMLKSYPLSMLAKMKETEQSVKYHPEGSVWNHTMMVLDIAAQVKEFSNDKNVFMWAALLHDIGKPDATKIRKGKITSYDHDKLGAELTVKFLSEFNVGEGFVEKTAALVRWHMQILFIANSLSFADIKSMKEQTDVNEVALLGYCDRMGRLGAAKNTELKVVNDFLRVCGGRNFKFN